MSVHTMDAIAGPQPTALGRDLRDLHHYFHVHLSTRADLSALPRGCEHWPVVHHAEDRFAERGEYRAIVDELEDFARDHDVVPRHLYLEVALDHGARVRVIDVDFEAARTAFGWPRFILANPDIPHVGELLDEISDNIETGEATQSFATGELHHRYFEDELEIAAQKQWAGMSVLERMAQIERIDEEAPSYLAFSPELPDHHLVVEHIKRGIAEVE